jgi:hypothetical protein
VSGNLLRQTCFSSYDKPEGFENSDIIHHNGLYVGLHSKVKVSDIEKLARQL